MIQKTITAMALHIDQGLKFGIRLPEIQQETQARTKLPYHLD
ncbi:hypothetical protein [Calothrix sp. PCC 7507]|nr:hypothetical protein [Calothrix sp. PCC 7507]